LGSSSARSMFSRVLQKLRSEPDMQTAKALHG